MLSHARILILAVLVLGVPAAHADRWDAHPVALQLAGDTANGTSGMPIASREGRWIAFQSRATNLLAGLDDDNGVEDVFLRDLVDGTTVLASRALGDALRTPNADSSPLAISDDGRYVVFSSYATDVLPGVTDANASADLFVFDRDTGATTLVTRRAAAPATTSETGVFYAEISGNGRYVAFVSSATTLIANYTATQVSSNAYLFDVQTGAMQMLSHAAGAPSTAGTGITESVRMDASGQWIAFGTLASNIVAGDTNGSYDIFLFDRASGVRTLVSHAASSASTPGNTTSTLHSISPDGRWILYTSLAQNLAAGVTDTAIKFDVFLWDRLSNVNTLASRPAGSTTTVPNENSIADAMSDDGEWVAFHSHATNLGAVDTNAAFASAYLFRRSTGTTMLVSRERGTTNVTAAGSASVVDVFGGFLLTFVSNGDNLVNGISDLNDGYDLFVFAPSTGFTTLITRAGSNARTGVEGSSGGVFAGLNLIFTSAAHDLADAFEDNNGSDDVFQRDLGSQALVPVSAGVAPLATTLGRGTVATQDPDGRFVAFVTPDPTVVSGVSDLNRSTDVYLLDRATGTKSLVSSAAGAPSVTANASASGGIVSADGRWVAYTTLATDVQLALSDANGTNDVFLRDISTGEARLVSRAAISATSTGNGSSTPFAISTDGRYVVFQSLATDLVTGIADTNARTDVFVYDRVVDLVALAARADNGTATTSGGARAAAMTPDGRFVLSTREALSFPATSSVVLFDRTTGGSTLVSHVPASATVDGGGQSTGRALSDDGEWALFTANAGNLVAGGTDANNVSDAFLFRRSTGAVSLVSHAVALPNTAAAGTSTARGLSADGRYVVYDSTADNVAAVTQANGTIADAYRYDRTSGVSVLAARAFGTADRTPNGTVADLAVSRDGRWVAFSTRANDVAAPGADTNGTASDTFVFDGSTGTTTHVSHAAGSAATANGEFLPAAISANGRYLLATTRATNIGVEDTNGIFDAFVAEHRFEVAVSLDPRGTVSPAGPLSVALGDTTAFTFGGTADYSVQVTGCGGSLAGAIYTTGAIDRDCTVVATFANAEPAIAAVPNVTLLEDAATRTIAVTVSDAESSPGALVLSAASADPAIVATPTVEPGATPAERLVRFAPIAQRNGGPVVVTLTLVDVPGAMRSATFAITITPVNDAPVLSFAASPRHAQGSAGAQSRPGFASVDLGPDDEDAVQAVEDYAVVSIADPAGVLAAGSLDLSNSGTLAYTLTGNAGTATVSATVRDDAGSQNGGQSTSAPVSFTVTVEGPTIFANGFE